MAAHYGCTLNEGAVHACMIGGEDHGEMLYTMGLLGWLTMAMLPFAFIAICILAGLYGLMAIIRVRFPH